MTYKGVLEFHWDIQRTNNLNENELTTCSSLFDFHPMKSTNSTASAAISEVEYRMMGLSDPPMPRKHQLQHQTQPEDSAVGITSVVPYKTCVFRGLVMAKVFCLPLPGTFESSKTHDPLGEV